MSARPAKRIDASLLRRWPLPKLEPHADKVSRGDVLVVGGSREIPGAVLLAGVAALRAGAGRVQVATARTAATALSIAFPEARVIALPETARGELATRGARELRKETARAKAVLVGPGMVEPGAAELLLREAAREGHEFTAVLDAAALRLFRNRTPLRSGAFAGVIATPHAGEMADFWGCAPEMVHRAPLELAVEAARCLGVTLVLKGQETHVVDPDGTAFRNVAGNSGLATAGSGDVLSGLIAGLAARGATPAQAAVWGVHLHATAGDELLRSAGPLGYLARELPARVPGLMARRERRSAQGKARR